MWLHHEWLLRLFKSFASDSIRNVSRSWTEDCCVSVNQRTSCHWGKITVCCTAFITTTPTFLSLGSYLMQYYVTMSHKLGKWRAIKVFYCLLLKNFGIRLDRSSVAQTNQKIGAQIYLFFFFIYISWATATQKRYIHEKQVKDTIQCFSFLFHPKFPTPPLSHPPTPTHYSQRVGAQI